MANNKPHFSFENNTKKWESTSLGNVLKINSGRDYKHLGVGEVPVYGTGGYMLSVNQSLSEEDAIGIGRKGTIDKPQLLHAPFWTVDTLFFMIPQKNNDLYFLYTYMQKIKWKNYDESSGVPSLSKLNIEKINMFIPDDEVQTKIGSFFKTLDDTISLHQQELEALKQTKQGFLQKMFPKDGETVPAVRFEKYTEKWQLKKLGDILKVNSGRDYKHLGTGNIPVYGTGGFMLNVNKSLSNEDAIGLGRKGTIDKPQLLKAPFWTVDTLFFMTMKKDIDLHFCYSLINMISWKKYDESTGVPSLSKTNIDKILVKVPSYEEQVEIGEFFRQLDEVIELKEKEIEALKETKKGFLQKMFV